MSWRRCSLQALVAAPARRYAAGPSWLYAYQDDRLSAFVAWGAIRGVDIAPILAEAPVPVSRGAREHALLFDSRRVDDIDAPAFRAAAAYLATYREALRPIRRVAILAAAASPAATPATVAAHGFLHAAAVPCEWQVFGAADAAVAWLGAGPTLVDELDALWRELAGVAPVVGELRAILAGDVHLDVAAAAGRLALSTRTLQRRLRDAGTSFQHELDRARVQAAQALMLASADKLDAIASAVGCASSAHLAVLFRRLEGCTPSAWREARAAGRVAPSC